MHRGAALRHANILYVKQSFTANILCAYPDGYVDPYPSFFAALEEVANKGIAAINALPATFSFSEIGRVETYFRHVRDVAVHLRAMAEKERRNEPLDKADIDYLNHMVSIDGSHAGCGGPSRAPSGWYADLHYSRDAILTHKPIVVDVHTQPTDEFGAPVGRVLHVGLTHPRQLVVTVRHDGGAHTQTYRGYVSSYSERITENFERLTDEAWQSRAAIDPWILPAWLEPITPVARPR